MGLSQEMELKEFVTKTILDIIDGVRDAQKLNKTTAQINAATASRGIENIDFDVALSVTDGDEKDRGITVSIPSISKVGSFRRKESRETTEQRVKFSVPVAYPFPNVPDPANHQK